MKETSRIAWLPISAQLARGRCSPSPDSVFTMPESAFSFPGFSVQHGRNRCSASAGIRVQLQSESAFSMGRSAQLLGSYLAPDFVTDGRSLILHGKTGRGKTHLSVAIAYRAIQHGFDALFTTAAQLIEDLSNAGRTGRLHEALGRYTHPHVLVIDEVGYLTYGPEAANVLYHVVNDRHLRKRPMVFTTNKPMHDWGRVLHDPDLASAILDRVLERGRWITLDGPSGRTKHLKLDPAIPQDGPGATVSGKLVPEFPEPTPPH